MKIPCIVFLLVAPVLSAQGLFLDPPAPAVEVTADDVAMPALRKWQKEVEENYAKEGVIEAEFTPWDEIKFPSLGKLFPGERFFRVFWMERPVRGKERQAIGLTALAYILACNADGKLVKEFYDHGSYEPFGELLALHKVAIRSPEDAKLVWDAFCDIHRKRWNEKSAVKINDTTWHLGVETNESGR